MIFETGFSIVVVLFAIYLFFGIMDYQIKRVTLGEPDIAIDRSLQELFGIGLGFLFLLLTIYYFYDDANTTKMDYYDIASNIFRIISAFEIILVSLSKKLFYEKGLLMLYSFISWDEVMSYKFEETDNNKLILKLKNWKHFNKGVQLHVQTKQHEEVEKYLASKVAVENIKVNQLVNSNNEVAIAFKSSKNNITLYLIPVIIFLLLGLVILGLLFSR